MRILIGYLIRAHVGPFFFALSALTGLLFVNAVAQRLQDLMGKGLTRDVVLEFMYLSLPHTIALTLPMAVLVSVLYAFSDLAASNEITAIKAGGVRPQRLLIPLLGVGTIVGLLMYVFNDQVLPEANHRLKNLLMDIGRKTPTFTMREQVVNTITLQEVGERVFLIADRIDNTSSALYDVEIVDPSDVMRHHRTLADSGWMRFNEARTDLYLILFDGVDYESSEDPPGSFSQVYFKKQIVPLRGIGNELDRQFGGGGRGDREMTIAMLAESADTRAAEADMVRERSLVRSRNAVRFALGYRVDDEDTFGNPVGLNPAAANPMGIPDPQAFRQQGGIEDHPTRRLAMAARSDQAPVMTLMRTADGFRLEIHKKISLAVACVVFVLVGAPLAVRFPRGGLGMVIAISSFVFAIYWMGLIGGENLANVGSAPPWLGMWLPNVVFTVLGLLLVKRMGRESATMRGGGWDDLLFTIRDGLSRPFRRPKGAGVRQWPARS
jgi:lipopolysaccharide export system permease protein